MPIFRQRKIFWPRGTRFYRASPDVRTWRVRRCQAARFVPKRHEGSVNLLGLDRESPSLQGGEDVNVEAVVTRPTDDLVVELVERLLVLEAKFEFFRKNGYEED